MKKKCITFGEQAALNIVAINRIRDSYVPFNDDALSFIDYMEEWEMTVMCEKFKELHEKTFQMNPADDISNNIFDVTVFPIPLSNDPNFILDVEMQMIWCALNERIKHGQDVCDLNIDDYNVEKVSKEAFSARAILALHHKDRTDEEEEQYQATRYIIKETMKCRQYPDQAAESFRIDYGLKPDDIEPVPPRQKNLTTGKAQVEEDTRRPVPFFDQAVRNADAILILLQCYEAAHDESTGEPLKFHEYYEIIQREIMAHNFARELGLTAALKRPMGYDDEGTADAYDETDDLYKHGTAAHREEHPHVLKETMFYYPARAKRSVDYAVLLDMAVIEYMIADYAKKEFALPDELRLADFDLDSINVQPFSRDAFEAMKERELNKDEKRQYEAAETLIDDANNFYAEIKNQTDITYRVKLIPQPN